MIEPAVGTLMTAVSWAARAGDAVLGACGWQSRGVQRWNELSEAAAALKASGSATVVTITTPAAGTYAIAADETVTIGPLPDTLGIVADGDVYPYTITPSPATFVITNA